jgi:hypothetical protein
MEADEAYLGGFFGFWSQLVRKWGSRPGVGFYVTNKRLFIFYKGDMDRMFNEFVTGSASQDFVPADLTPEQNQAIIHDLSSRYARFTDQFCFRREEISSLEIGGPPGSLRTGYVIVKTTSGESLNLVISEEV